MGRWDTCWECGQCAGAQGNALWRPSARGTSVSTDGAVTPRGLTPAGRAAQLSDPGALAPTTAHLIQRPLSQGSAFLLSAGGWSAGQAQAATSPASLESLLLQVSQGLLGSASKKPRLTLQGTNCRLLGGCRTLTHGANPGGYQQVRVWGPHAQGSHEC